MPASCPAPDDTFTTRPYLRFTIGGTKTRQTSMTPRRFVSSVLRNASAGIVRTLALSASRIPALLTRTSALPKRSTIVAYALLMLFVSVTSRWTPVAFSPSLRAARATAECDAQTAREQLARRLQSQSAIRAGDDGDTHALRHQRFTAKMTTFAI